MNLEIDSDIYEAHELTPALLKALRMVDLRRIPYLSACVLMDGAHTPEELSSARSAYVTTQADFACALLTLLDVGGRLNQQDMWLAGCSSVEEFLAEYDN